MHHSADMDNIEKKIFTYSMVLPFLFLLLIILLKTIELTLHVNFYQLGIYPRSIQGLIGIATAPFVHADFNHIGNNSVPLFFLTLALFYFYRSLGYRVFLWIYILSGLGVWIIGRPSYHIGASGIVYGLATFLFFSGIFRRYPKLIAVSLVVVFLYGGMIWGIFPIDYVVSWESHLSGSVWGFILAVVYRNELPQRPIHDWENEIETDDDEPEPAAE